jgi:hypothetical protein
MGSLYRPKYRAGDGTVKESAVIWLKYCDALGVVRRESSETEKEQEARRLLKQREGAAVEGRIIVPRADRITFAQLAETLRDDYKANGRKSAERLELSLAHLLPHFGPSPAARIGTSDVTAFTVRRQAEGAANASINRELAAMKRAFSLAVNGERLQRRPYIPMLKENNVCTGFVEPGQLDAIRRHLPDYAADYLRLPHGLAAPVRSAAPAMAPGRPQGGRRHARCRQYEVRPWPHLPTHAGPSGGARGTAHRHRGDPAQEADHRPVGIPPPGPATEGPPEVVACRDEGGRTAGPHSARSPAQLRPEPGTGRRAALDGNGLGRSQDGGDLLAVRDHR